MGAVLCIVKYFSSILNLYLDDIPKLWWPNLCTAKSLQSCLTLRNPVDGSLPGSTVPGILQARTLEWVAISVSTAWKWKWKWSHSVVSDSMYRCCQMSHEGKNCHALRPTGLKELYVQERKPKWGKKNTTSLIMVMSLMYLQLHFFIPTTKLCWSI